MPETKLPAPGVGDLTALLPSWRLHLEASNLSPRTIRAYTDDGARLAAFLAIRGMPTAVLSIRREHVEAFIVAELERTSPSSAATRYRVASAALQLAGRRGRDRGVALGQDAAAQDPRQAGTRALRRSRPAAAGELLRQGLRNRRDSAIIGLFLDTGMRLEGMSGLQYNADDPESSDVGLTSRAARITAKGRRELVLPIGSRTASDIDRYLRVATCRRRCRDS